MREFNNYINIISMIATTIGLACLSQPSISHATQSTEIRTAVISPAQRTTVLQDCYQTSEEIYNVTANEYHSAYPTCKPEMVATKASFRTVRNFMNVDTYVSVTCCKPNVEFPKQQPA